MKQTRTAAKSAAPGKATVRQSAANKQTRGGGVGEPGKIRRRPAVTAPAPRTERAGTAVLQRADWVRSGMRILARSGVDAVLVPPLAKELGVTKGSFYWHFSSRDDLLAALIEEWKQHATLRVIEIVEAAETTAREKIRLIAFIGTNSPIDEFGGAIELAMRNWARTSPNVRKVVAEVDRERLNYLTQLYSETGSHVDPELLACLHYSFSAGLRLIFAYPEKQKLAMREAALDQVFLADHFHAE
ncbi:TetR/AcrR family transcriptional regulator [Comamonadaceae bacterium G21597-S1]|nr:TetR/AcrR family transcriptional regulator [Comamonadaceae bacterium G21597-S1]